MLQTDLTDSNDEMERLKELIRERCHLDFRLDFFRYLEEAVRARIRATATTDVAAYWKHSKQNPGELKYLINLLTNNETYFLRESPHYLLLTKKLFPDLLRTRTFYGQPVNILSAGCASGEEPYSLVIALVEAFGEGVVDQIQVTGLDINEEVLHKASMGVYGSYSFRGVNPEVRGKHFDDFTGNRFVLNEAIRQKVNFTHHNLADWPYPEDAQKADLIFYRNVSIYYQQETQQTIFDNLSRLLTPQGFLIVGSVEVTPHDTGKLNLCNDEDIFFFSKAPSGADTKSNPVLPGLKRIA